MRTLSFRSLRGLAVCDPRRAGSVSGYGAESRHHLDRWKSLAKIMLDSRLEHVPVAAISLEDLIGVVGIVRIPRAIGRVSNIPGVDRHSAPRIMLQTTPTEPAALARRPDTVGPLAVATPTTRKLADASISVNT